MATTSSASHDQRPDRREVARALLFTLVVVTDFATSIDRLLNQVRVWEQPRWRVDGRADRTYALAQLLADLGADAESRPRRPLPREHDMTLPDQIRVMADDLLAATPPASVLAEAATAVDDLRNTLDRK